MASRVNDVPVSFALRRFGEFFHNVSCIAATAIRFLSFFLLPPMEETGAVARKVETITRCMSHCCRMERTASPPADRTSTFAADDDDDDDLFAPIPPRPECPICMLTLPLKAKGITYMSCCGNKICTACELEMSRVIKERNKERRAKDPHSPPCLLKDTCPLCRERIPENDEARLARLRDRMERNDAGALCVMAQKYSYGRLGLQKDESKAFELYFRAAELGDISAHHHVAVSYLLGKGVEKDEEMCLRYLVPSVKGGNVRSRAFLGTFESDRGNHALAYKHWRISIAAGCDYSLRFIEREFEEGRVAEDEYAAACRDYQKARNEMQSDERDKYFASLREMKRKRDDAT